MSIDAQTPPAGPYQAQPVERWAQGTRSSPVLDCLIEEVPVALEFNGISYATMLMTPSDLEDFARGFALTEGIVQGVHEIYDIDCEVTPEGVVLHIDIASACAHRLKGRRRALAGRTGCGLCGVESLDQVRRPLLSEPERWRNVVVSQAAVLKAHQAMAAQQPLFKTTGASHAAALAHLDGGLIAVREDVGRHNALDKLIGATAARRESGMVIVSSRASFEMVQKTVAAGHPVLAAVSAPTAMAQRLAQDSDLVLMGFVREQRLTVYAGMQRVVL